MIEKITIAYSPIHEEERHARATIRCLSRARKGGLFELEFQNHDGSMPTMANVSTIQLRAIRDAADAVLNSMEK